MKDNEILEIMETLFEKYEDLSGDYMIPQIKKYRATCRTRFYDEPDINYFSDESQIYDIIKDLRKISNDELVINVIPAYDEYDWFRIDIYY